MKVKTLEPQLNLFLLNEALYQRKNDCNCIEEPYIICSESTAQLFKAQCKPFYEDCRSKGIPGNKVAIFEGYKVLTDNTLPLGTFDIR